MIARMIKVESSLQSVTRTRYQLTPHPAVEEPLDYSLTYPSNVQPLRYAFSDNHSPPARWLCRPSPGHIPASSRRDAPPTPAASAPSSLQSSQNRSASCCWYRGPPRHIFPCRPQSTPTGTGRDSGGGRSSQLPESNPRLCSAIPSAAGRPLSRNWTMAKPSGPGCAFGNAVKPRGSGGGADAGRHAPASPLRAFASAFQSRLPAEAVAGSNAACSTSGHRRHCWE